MTFTPNIPQATQSLGQTQAAIQNNFTNYNTVVSVDHVAPNALNQGNHKQVTFYQYGSAPYTTGANQSFLYTLNASASGSQLVYQPTVVNPGFAVPVSPRAIARILRTNLPLAYTVAGGPYGASTAFNTAAPTTTSLTQFTFNFASALATTDYFVYISFENVTTGLVTYTISNKTTAGFIVYHNAPNPVSNVYIAVTVY